MRNVLGLLVFCLTILFSSCHKQQDTPQLMSIQLVDRNGFNETISTPERLSHYANTNFLDSQPYVKIVRLYQRNEDGKICSIVTSYHENGHIWQSLESCNGRANGDYREWHPNGVLKAKARVIEGMGDLSAECIKTWVFDGISEIYDEKERLIATICYERGELAKESTYYYPNGKIKRIIPFVHHQVHGTEKLFDEEEQEIGMVSYSIGRRDGKSEYFGSKDSPKFSEEYDKGLLMEGIYYNTKGEIFSEIHDGQGFQSVFENGLLSCQQEYKNGEQEGKVLLYDSSENLSSEHQIKNGLKHGEEWVYQNNGSKPKIFMMWHEGRLQGRTKTWFSSGALESEREFYQNKKHGSSLAFYKDGSLMMIEEYENDVLVKGTYMKKSDKSIASSIENGDGIATLFDPDGVLLRRVSYFKGQPSNE